MSEQIPEPAEAEPEQPAASPTERVVPEQPTAETLFTDPDDSGSLWLGETDFIAAATSSPQAEPTVIRRPGPGLLESFGWMVGVFVLQLAGGLLAVVVLAGIYYAETGTFENLLNWKSLQEDNLGLILAVSQGVSLAGIALATWLRLGRERKRMLPRQPIAWRHLLAIILAVLPMMILAVQLSVVVNVAWTSLTDVFPGLRSLDKVSSQTAVKKMAEQLSFGMMILLVAVCPAIGEELVFRGVIGRGLIARWGLPARIAITSVLFAAMHLHPPHVIVLLPLSVYLHVAYLTTRSFRAPMLIHFLNNAFAVLALTIVVNNPELAKGEQAAESVFSPGLAFGSAVFFVLLLAFLWQTRVQFYRADGSVWNPGYPTVETPPDDVFAEPYCTPAEGREWALLGVGLLVFLLGAILPAVL